MARRILKTAIFDVETNGLLPELTRVHSLVIQEYESGDRWVFRRNSLMDNIREGLHMLAEAEVIAGHNILHFDIPAIEKVYPEWSFTGKVRDTLVMVRQVYADQKEKDFVLWKRGKLPGGFINNHSLDAWGHRVGLFKGDYAKMMEERGLDPWAAWNKDMEEYCINDVAVTVAVWKHCHLRQYPEAVMSFEHQTHDLGGVMENNGFMLNVPATKELADEIEQEAEELKAIAVAHYGSWYAPNKKYIVKPQWEDPNADDDNGKKGKKKKKKEYKNPRKAHGEDYDRALWADIKIPAQTRTYKSLYRMNEKKGIRSLNTNTIEGVAYCEVKLKDFNPASRDHVVDRFTTVYEWEPLDFTDAGAPSVDDTVLRNLIGEIPMAEELAEIFYLNKRLGQIKTGKNAWLKMVDENGFLHPRLNTGGTVSGRCSHSNPNIGQVPRVVVMDVLNKDGNFNKQMLDECLEPKPFVFDADGNLKKKVVLKGRAGKHGWDCRNLFTVPEGWRLVGCDLSGIELRCLANLACIYDNGYLISLILEGDIHTANQEAAGLQTRDQAKTFIYALIYGAGDAKIGSIVKPLASTAEQKRIGKELKEQFFKNMPGLASVVASIQKEAKKDGVIKGLDGRPLRVRGLHAALNLRLQSDAAVIAKRWLLNTEEYLLDDGLVHGWDGDFVMCAFVHDEIQIAVREEHVDHVKSALKEAAYDAGTEYGFRMDVDSESKDGLTWAETH